MRPDTGSPSRNDPVENGERDRHGRFSPEGLRGWSAKGKRFTKRYSFSRRNVFGQRPKAAGATPALPFQIESFRLRIRVIQSFSGSQPLLAGRETISCGCILRALCRNPGARPSWPQHIRRPEKLLIMAWPVSRRDCCGRDARAPFGLANAAPTTRRNPFLYTLFALPWQFVTACSLFSTS